MVLANPFFHNSISLLADASDGDSAKVALYGAFALIIATFITGFFNLLSSRAQRRKDEEDERHDRHARYRPRPVPDNDASQHEQALTLWIALHTDADPTRIITGEERPDEVRRHAI